LQALAFDKNFKIIIFHFFPNLQVASSTSRSQLGNDIYLSQKKTRH